VINTTPTCVWKGVGSKRKRYLFFPSVWYGISYQIQFRSLYGWENSQRNLVEMYSDVSEIYSICSVLSPIYIIIPFFGEVTLCQWKTGPRPSAASYCPLHQGLKCRRMSSQTFRSLKIDPVICNESSNSGLGSVLTRKKEILATPLIKPQNLQHLGILHKREINLILY
jgi:hypothetical protein